MRCRANRRKENGMTCRITDDVLLGGAELDGESGDDETAEGAVELVGVGADKLSISAGGIAASQFCVLGIAILPESEALRVGHLGFALRDGLRESEDNWSAVLRDRAFVRVHNRVSMRATVASSHNNTFLSGKFATKIIKGKCRFYMCHTIIRLA